MTTTVHEKESVINMRYDLRPYIGAKFKRIPEDLWPGVIGCAVVHEGQRLYIVNECMDGTYGISSAPPAVRFDNIINKDVFAPYDSALYRYDTRVWLYDFESMIYTGDYHMKELGDELNSVLESIEELFNDDLVKPEAATAATIIPEGYKAMSDCVGWAASFGDLPVKMFDFEDSPELNPHWIWQRSQFEEFLVAANAGENIRLVGPPGTGKTDFAKNFAALTRRPLYLVSFNRALELSELLGEKELTANEYGTQTGFVHGPIIAAVQRPSVIVLDEVSRASSSMYLGLLQNLLDKRQVIINSTGETFHCHPDCIIVGCDNSLGIGDNMEKYPTANVQDVSTINRWQTTINVGYLPPDQFASLILSHVPKLAPNQAAKLAKLAAMCQNAFVEGELPLTFSARQGIPIAKKAVVFNDMRRAIQVTYTNTLDPESRAVVDKMISSIWG